MKYSTKMHKNLFCSNWKWNGISFNKAIEELKRNLKVVDKVISDKHFKIFFYLIIKLKNSNLNQLT